MLTLLKNLFATDNRLISFIFRDKEVFKRRKTGPFAVASTSLSQPFQTKAIPPNWRQLASNRQTGRRTKPSAVGPTDENTRQTASTGISENFAIEASRKLG